MNVLFPVQESDWGIEKIKKKKRHKTKHHIYSTSQAKK